MRNERKARSLTMAAVFAALFSVPSIVLAGPKFEELERAVAADVMDADAINAALLKALGSDQEAVKALQRECFGTRNPTLVTGKIVANGSTQSCIRAHAEAMARARKHAADDRAAIDAELGTCKAGAGDCVAARDAAAAERDRLRAERDALAARVTSGDAAATPGPVDLTAWVNRNCPPGFQGQWLSSGELECRPARVKPVLGRPVSDASGTAATASLKLDPPAGREGLGQFPIPPPPPEPRATCDGAGGKLLCYVLPVAAAVVGGLLIADAASEDFNLVNVRR